MKMSYDTASDVIFHDHPRSHRLQELKKYINEKIKPLPLKYLFFNQQGRPMDTRHVFRIIQEIGKQAGIENLYPHMLRHTFASTLRGKGADLLLIKEALGHSSVSTTQIYAHLGAGEYQSKMKELIN
jgi:integrase/recombinase XerD